MAFNVFVTRMIPEAGLEVLRQECDQVEVNPQDRPLAKPELIGAVRDRDGVLCLLTDTIDKDVLEAANASRVFSNYAVGFDNIDVAEATKRGIIVTNTPGVLTDATAELAWALLFSIARRTAEADRFTRRGKFRGWSPTLLLGSDITGKTLGIVGAGRIGTAMAMKSAGFGMKVLYTDPRPNPLLEQKLGARRVELHELLQASDFVSLHVTLTPETRHLIGKEELNRMKPAAYLINTSRGAAVDEQALVEALKAGELKGAGLDVYENEPELTPGLEALENVVLLPHLGSATEGTRSRMAVMAAGNLVAALQGKVPPHCINPEALRC